MSEWRVLESKIVLKDRWIDLRAQKCLTPAGVEISPYYILNFPDWVHVVAVTERDELVVVREYRHGAREFCYGLPAGAVETHDSDPLEAARRELLEEAGFEARDFRKVASLRAEPARQANFVHVFLAECLTGGRQRSLDAGEEGMTVDLLPLPELLGKLSSGILSHTAHVASVVLALQAAGRLKLNYGLKTGDAANEGSA